MGTLQTATSQMIFLQPEKPEGYALRAVAYINQKKFQLAQQDIDKAIAVDPTSQLGYVQLGNLQFAETDYAGAARSYQQGLDRDPNSSDALRGLMNSYLAQHQIDRAVAAANSQIAKAPENSEFYNLLGTSLFRAKRDFSGAEAAFSKALQLDPRNTDARLKLAQAQSTAGKLDQAIATCQQGIQTQPRVADFYILLGELYQAKENWSLAKSSLEKAREIQPGNPVTNRELANVLLDSGGNLDEALSLAQSAQRSAPNSPGAADTLGWVYYQKGEYGLALNILQQAFKLMQSQNASDNADIHYHLGLAYQKTSHPAQARQHLEQALKIDPNYPAADDIRKQLTTLKS
jgi:tetratricopeptide (TPR) repeat protein